MRRHLALASVKLFIPHQRLLPATHCPQTLRRSLSGKKVLGLVVISSFGVVGYSRMPH